MALNPNAIVMTQVRLSPPFAGREPEEWLRAEPDAAVELGGGRRARLPRDDPRSPAHARILAGLAEHGLPVYLDLDPDSSMIRRLLIPQIVRVRTVTARESVLDVALDPSQARHVVRLGEPDTAELEGLLRAAARDGGPVLLTADDGHVIVDVRAYTPGPGDVRPPLPPHPEKPPDRRTGRRRFPPGIRCILCWLWWWLRCPSAARAQQVFDAMAATSCDPATIAAPCIPFRYPDDGCWARAHEMCRLMIAMGLSPDKVWITASSGSWLHVSTRNNPQCFVEWGWHVAPTLCVRSRCRWRWHTQRMVIDPSLFPTPVTEATWKGVQGDPAATLTQTSAAQFWPGGGDDPTYSSTDYYLAYYRQQLQLRVSLAGPPPYANCP